MNGPKNSEKGVSGSSVVAGDHPSFRCEIAYDVVILSEDVPGVELESQPVFQEVMGYFCVPDPVIAVQFIQRIAML